MPFYAVNALSSVLKKSTACKFLTPLQIPDIQRNKKKKVVTVCHNMTYRKQTS